MKTLRESFATLRQPLGALIALVGGAAFLAAVAVLLLPALPSDLQRSAVTGLSLLPGIESGVTVAPDDPTLIGYLRVPGVREFAATFGGDDEAWQRRDFSLHGPQLALFAALCAGALGLLAHVLWFVTASRRIAGLALVFGVASGLIVAHSLPALPRYWASAWIGGIGGLPGLEEKLGSPVGIENQPSSAYLVSAGGRVLDYPPTEPPWPSDARVEITGRGRSWFAAYGVAGWLALLSVAAGLRATRWRSRVLLTAFGLGGLCWLALPFLPRGVGEATADLLDLTAGSIGLEASTPLSLVLTTRLGVSVSPALLAVLVGAWLLALAPVGLIGAGLGALRSRAAGKAAEEKQEEALAPLDPIPVSGSEHPDWMDDYEDRRKADPEAVEPHPSPHDEP